MLQGCRVLKAARHSNVDVNLSSDPEISTAKELTNGKGPDVVVDTTGSQAVIGPALLALAPGGRISYIAALRQGSTELTFDMLHVYREQKVIVGCNSVREDQSKTAEVLRALTGGFESGKLVAEKEDNIQRVPFQDTIAAYEGTGLVKGKKPVIVFGTGSAL
jgi:NADPH:quinone reductase